MTFYAHRGIVRSLVQLSNGYLVSGSQDSTINIYDPRDNFNLVIFSLHLIALIPLLNLRSNFLIVSFYHYIIRL